MMWVYHCSIYIFFFFCFWCVRVNVCECRTGHVFLPFMFGLMIMLTETSMSYISHPSSSLFLYLLFNLLVLNGPFSIWLYIKWMIYDDGSRVCCQRVVSLLKKGHISPSTLRVGIYTTTTINQCLVISLLNKNLNWKIVTVYLRLV